MTSERILRESVLYSSLSYIHNKFPHLTLLNSRYHKYRKNIKVLMLNHQSRTYLSNQRWNLDAFTQLINPSIIYGWDCNIQLRILPGREEERECQFCREVREISRPSYRYKLVMIMSRLRKCEKKSEISNSTAEYNHMSIVRDPNMNYMHAQFHTVFQLARLRRSSNMPSQSVIHDQDPAHP